MLWITALFFVAAMAISFWKNIRCASTADYLLSGRRQFSRVAGMSAQVAFLGYFFTVTVPMKASETTGDVLSVIFALTGMIAGIFLSRFLVSRRLRIYSELSGNSLSYPEFLENRFNDKSGVLRAVSASIVLIFGILLAAELILMSASVLDGFTGIGVIQSVIVCGLLVAVFTFIGGLPAIASTGLIKALALLAAFIFIIVSFFIPTSLNQPSFAESGVLASSLSSVGNSGVGGTVLSCITGFVSYALVFFGIPFINTSYMSTKERRIPKRKIFSEFIWTVPCAVGAAMAGIIISKSASGAFASPAELVKAIQTVASEPSRTFITALMFVICLTTSDSCVFTAGESFSYDLFLHGNSEKCAGKDSVNLIRLGVAGASVVAVLYAIFFSQTDFITADFLISCVSSAFGPVTVFCLFCGFLTVKGAVASVAGGLAFSAGFSYFCYVNSFYALPAIIPSFIFGTILLFAVSFFDRKNVSKKTGNEFGRTKEIARLKQ